MARSGRTSSRAWVAAVLTVSAAFAAVPHAAGAAFSSGSTGADGAFNPTCSPTPCTVETALPANGVFNFTTVNIPSGVTATFSRNSSNTPVIILASSDVSVLGTIDVSGLTAGPSTLPGRGGPGGFDGGAGASVVSPSGGTGLGPGGGGGGIFTGNTANNRPGAGGFGSPGGTSTSGGSPSPGGPSYGVPALIPLIGGSGGGGGAINGCGEAGGGGGGGGAILIASSGTITVTGAISANGGTGSPCINGCNTPQSGAGGSGGAIRLVANAIAGAGSISAAGGAIGGGGCNNPDNANGGLGRIRLEAVNLTFAGTLGPASSGFPGPVNVASFPTVGIVAVNSVAAPAAPRGSFDAPADVTLSPVATNPVTVSLQASNVPVGTLIAVTVTPESGSAVTVNSSPLAGTNASSTATATVSLPNGISVIGAAATFATQ